MLCKSFLFHKNKHHFQIKKLKYDKKSPRLHKKSGTFFSVRFICNDYSAISASTGITETYERSSLLLRNSTIPSVSA